MLLPVSGLVLNMAIPYEAANWFWEYTILYKSNYNAMIQHKTVFREGKLIDFEMAFDSLDR